MLHTGPQSLEDERWRIPTGGGIGDVCDSGNIGAASIWEVLAPTLPPAVGKVRFGRRANKARGVPWRPAGPLHSPGRPITLAA